jgi:hypothetical protein
LLFWVMTRPGHAIAFENRAKARAEGGETALGAA